MFDYIFNSLKRTDKRLDSICKVISKQHGFNRAVTAFAIGTTIILVIDKIELRDQAMRIRKLEKEVESINNMRGDEK